MAAKKVKKFTPVANPILGKSLAERAQGGSWGTHLDGRERRARTRSASRGKAIQDSARY